MLLVHETESGSQAFMLGCRKTTFKTGLLFFSPDYKKEHFKPCTSQYLNILYPGKDGDPSPRSKSVDCGPCNSALAEGTQVVLTAIHRTLLHSWHKAFCGAVFRRGRTEEEVTSCCCAKVKGDSSVPGAYHQASVSWLPQRPLRGENLFDGHSSGRATSFHMFRRERRKEGASHLNLQQSPVLHREEKNREHLNSQRQSLDLGSEPGQHHSRRALCRCWSFSELLLLRIVSCAVETQIK